MKIRYIPVLHLHPLNLGSLMPINFLKLKLLFKIQMELNTSSEIAITLGFFKIMDNIFNVVLEVP